MHLLLSLLFILNLNFSDEDYTGKSQTFQTPTLVVGIMVDQMRPDYIYRFWDHLGDNGFKRMVNDGFTFTNTHFNYMPTSTGPGHASVWAGSTPSVHGVMGNSWFVRELSRSINVIEVPGYDAVGGTEDSDGAKAPSNMLTTTIGDELRLHTNNRSKVIGISRKDRGAILPAGHMGDAYWYDSSTGHYITSTYYREELPDWLKEFNALNLPQQYLSEPWETLYPIETYIESIDDDNSYEGLIYGQEAPVFPHDLPGLMAEHDHNLGLLSNTPFSDKHLMRLAIAAIEGENLGGESLPDILAISFSAIDAIGHRYGPASKEIQDAFIRLDSYLGTLLDYLEENIGKENFLVFVTSDHGGLHVPEYLADQKIPAARINFSEYAADLSNYVESTYGQNFIIAGGAYELFFDRDYIASQGLNLGEVQKDIARYLLHFDGVAGALAAETLITTEFTRGIPKIVQEGFNKKRSGDVMIWLEPKKYPSGGTTGTGHGSPWVYDTHAPMHWYGGVVSPGNSAVRTYITDIASTVATFLNSPFPSGNTGNPLIDYMKN
ncbi:MAG: alkaline phosphatase family protein [Balneolaceae bacterium]|nr:MAG: alkaline phosphatase family protein [Balneolaceae bacterium]